MFGVGLQKTGTSTLGKVLSILGYEIKLETDYDLVDALLAGDLDQIKERVKDFDAFEDNPWPIVFKELDEWYPGSKFILTLRDEDNWMRSISNHFGTGASEFRKWYYGEGAPVGNEELYREKFRNHNQAVKEYFASRKNDFLIVDFEKGDGWKKICKFLGEPIPNKPFPHLNKNKNYFDKLMNKFEAGVNRIKKGLGREV